MAENQTYIYHETLHPSKHAEFRRVFAEQIGEMENARKEAIAKYKPLTHEMETAPYVVFFGNKQTTYKDGKISGLFVIIYPRKPNPLPTLEEVNEIKLRAFKQAETTSQTIPIVFASTHEQRDILNNPTAPDPEEKARQQQQDEKRARLKKINDAERTKAWKQFHTAQEKKYQRVKDKWPPPDPALLLSYKPITKKVYEEHLPDPDLLPHWVYDEMPPLELDSGGRRKRKTRRRKRRKHRKTRRKHRKTRRKRRRRRRRTRKR